jgi:hypothetical protein
MRRLEKCSSQHFECGACNHSATSPVRPQIAARHNSRKRPLVHPSGASPAQPPIPCGSCSRRPMRRATPPRDQYCAYWGLCSREHERGRRLCGSQSVHRLTPDIDFKQWLDDSAAPSRCRIAMTREPLPEFALAGGGRSAGSLNVTADLRKAVQLPRGAAWRAECRKY